MFITFRTTIVTLFNRIFVAQSQLEGLPIMTADPSFSLYEIEVI